jgi:hypothetical protein
MRAMIRIVPRIPPIYIKISVTVPNAHWIMSDTACRDVTAHNAAVLGRIFPTSASVIKTHDRQTALQALIVVIYNV